MEQLRVVVADADEASRGRLRALFARRTDARVVADCTDGFEAATAIARLRPSAAFLDVNLPGLDGFSVCGQLGDMRPEIVFFGSAAADAVRAFELPALDYILKPFGDHRFQVSVERVRAAVAARLGGAQSLEFHMLLREIRARNPEH